MDPLVLCGVDEAGRGPVLGPLVIAGYMIDDEERLRELQVRDSKKCTPEKRDRLSRELKRIGRWSFDEWSAEEIDQFRLKSTLNKLEAIGFAAVIERLRPKQAVVDSADVNQKAFRDNILRALPYRPEILSEHKADSTHLVVAAASILAKTHRDRRLGEIESDLRLPLGSGYPSDVNTIHFLENWIRDHGDLPPHARRSWKTSRRLLALHHTKTLTDFTQG